MVLKFIQSLVSHWSNFFESKGSKEFMNSDIIKIIISVHIKNRNSFINY